MGGARFVFLWWMSHDTVNLSWCVMHRLLLEIPINSTIHTMATPSRVVTLEDLNNVMPSLRLKLEDQASSLKAKKPRQRNLVDRASTLLENIFADGQEGFKLEQTPSRQATERNMRQIDEMFDKMEKKLQQQREEVKRELPNLPEDQQQSVVIFWAAVSEFLDDVLNWLKNVFTYVLDKIRQGFTLVRDAVRGIFDWIREFLKQVF